MRKKEIILKAKKQVAEQYGFEPLLGSEWETAMLFEHRRKNQILLYEAVCNLLGETIEKLT